MAKENGIAEELSNFNWDSNVTDVDFFGETTSIKEEESKEKEVEQEEEGKKKPESKKEEEKKKEEEENAFSAFEEEEESSKKNPTYKEKEKTDEEDEPKSAEPATVVNFLIDQGILDMDEDELKEFDELDEIDKAEVVKDYFEKAVEDRFAEGIKSLPDTLKNLIKYAINGGNVNTLIQSMSKSTGSGLSEDMDLENVNDQEALVRQKLVDEEYDEDYITSQLDYLKDSDKLKITAEKYFDKWKKGRSAEQEKEVKRIEALKKAARENEIKFKKDISEFTSKLEDIKGFKLSKKDVNEMPDYIGTQNVKLQDGRTITPFYRDLFEAMKDKEKLVLMAKLLRSDFDFSSVTKSVDTKRTRELKDNLQRQSESKSVKSNNGSSQKPQRLVDLLD